MRKLSKKALVFGSSAAVAALVISGCSSGTSSEPTASSAAAEASSAPASAAASSEAPAAPAEGDVVLTDAYSVALAESAQTAVDTAGFKKTAPFKLATITQGPINGWGTIFDVTMNKALTDSGQVDMDNLLYAAWNGKTENETKAMDDAIAAKVDGIILTSLSRAGLSASVERATAAGIPVLTCMAGVESPKYTSEVSRNIPAMGYASAKALVDKLGGTGKVVMLNGIAGVDAAELWNMGAKAAFAEAPGIEVVAEQNGNWSAADATTVMRTVVAQQPQIDAVWVGGLEMGSAVVSAFGEAGLAVPFISGTNPTNGFLKVAKDQSLDFYASPFPPGGAKVCVDQMLKILNGESVQKFTDVKDLMDGTAPYGSADIDKWFVPALNDDFIGPLVYDEAFYAENGFARK